MQEIDYNRLDRDFRTNPYVSKKGNGCIKKIDMPSQHDLEYLYIELNIRQEDIKDLLGVSLNTFRRWLSFYKIKKPHDKMVQNVSKTNLERYGVAHYAGNLNKAKQTKLQKYGNEKYVNVEKMQQTKLERYCVKTFNNHEKSKKTCLEKYGKEYYTQTDECKEKTKQTNIEKYNSLTPVGNNHIKQKIQENSLKNYGTNFPQQKHYSREVYEILSDRKLLYEYIIDAPIKTYLSLAQGLGVNDTNLRRIIYKYKLEDMIDSSWSTSSDELFIRNYINEYVETVNNVKLLDGKEIDIYIPKLNLGIEFNGSFWHNECGKDKQYHQNKTLLAESKGIFLYHIFEYEWNTKREKILNQLNNLLGINKEKIYARKCEIKTISTDEKKIFLEKNHLQGNDSSSIKIGLYYNDELVSLMTFCKPRFNKKYEWELSRFCSKANCNVIGGASKLFKYFINTYKPKSIISYSNIAHTRGQIYSKIGFSYHGYSQPNYIWWKKGDVKTRYQCQKNRLIKNGCIGNTEVQIMHNLGYLRIYDCGNKIWIWKK